MAEVAGGFAGFGVERFDDVFDHEAAAAEVAEDFFPAVQILQRPFLPVRAAEDGGERAGSIIRLGQFIAAGGRLDFRRKKVSGTVVSLFTHGMQYRFTLVRNLHK